MPGKPLPGKAPTAPTLASQRRDDDRSREQLDRRINRNRGQELLVHVSPDPPGWKVGRLWYKTDEGPA